MAETVVALQATVMFTFPGTTASEEEFLEITAREFTTPDLPKLLGAALDDSLAGLGVKTEVQIHDVDLGYLP